MGTHTIMKVCGCCNGTGKFLQVPFSWTDSAGNPQTATEIDCPVCGGVGEIEWGDDRSIINCPTSLILENTDTDEYAALSANKKTFYALFISAGTLDMSEGTQANVMFLTTLFPVGTASNAAITSALETF